MKVYTATIQTSRLLKTEPNQSEKRMSDLARNTVGEVVYAIVIQVTSCNNRF